MVSAGAAHNKNNYQIYNHIMQIYNCFSSLNSPIILFQSLQQQPPSILIIFNTKLSLFKHNNTIITKDMLTSDIARQILHTVNLQINSNQIFIQPTPPFFDINGHYRIHRDTKKALAQLYESYPSERLKQKNNLLFQFAMLYTQFRSAVNEQDDPLLHRYLTNALYQQYKDNRKDAFKIYEKVYNIRLKQAQTYENEYGRWVQCLIETKHEQNQEKQHIVERKLGIFSNNLRTWYFTRFNYKV